MALLHESTAALFSPCCGINGEQFKCHSVSATRDVNKSAYERQRTFARTIAILRCNLEFQLSFAGSNSKLCHRQHSNTECSTTTEHVIPSYHSVHCAPLCMLQAPRAGGPP